MRGKSFISGLLICVALAGQLVFSFLGVRIPVAQAGAGDPSACNSASTSVITSVTLAGSQTATGIQLKMNLHTNVPITTGGPTGEDTSIDVTLYRKTPGATDWTAYKTANTSKNSNVLGLSATNNDASFSYLDPKVADPKDIAKGVFPGTSANYTYLVWARQSGGPNTDYPNCSTKQTILFTGTSAVVASTVPCPTGVKVANDNALSVDKTSIDLVWAFDASSLAKGSKVTYKAKLNDQLPPNDTINTYTDTKGTVKGLPSNGVQANKIQILATVDGKTFSAGCPSFNPVVGPDGKVTLATVNDNPTIAGVTIFDRCGDGASFVSQPSQFFLFQVCLGVVTLMDIGGVFLDMGGTLLLKTSGIPGSDDDTANLFSSIDNGSFIGPVQDKLLDTQGGQLTRNVYNYVLGFTNVGVLLLLIVIALANILQIQVNVYSLKKLLPGLIVGLILANMSFFLVRAALELSGSIAVGVQEQLGKNCTATLAGTTSPTPTTTTTTTGATTAAEPVLCGYNSYHAAFRRMGSVRQDPNLPLTKPTVVNVAIPILGTGISIPTPFTTTGNVPDLGLVFQQFILNFFLFAAAAIVMVLGFLFLLRTFVFFFAVSIAPFAFLGLYFPPMASVWQRWSKLVTSWLFMPVVAFFWLWMGFLWFKAVPPTGGFVTTLLGYSFGLAAMWLAVKTPFSMAGEAKSMYGKLESKINAAPGKIWDATGGGQLKRTGEAASARLKATKFGDIQRNLARKDEDRKDRNKTFSEGYNPKALDKINKRKEDLNMLSQKITEDQKKQETLRAQGNFVAARELGVEIAKDIDLRDQKQVAMNNGDGFDRGMKRALRILQDDKNHGLAEEKGKAKKEQAIMTAEEILAKQDGKQGDHYRELKDAIKDSQIVTREVAEVIRRRNELDYADGRVGGSKDKKDALLKQWRLESNMRAEGLKMSLDKAAEDRLKQAQFLTLLRGKPKKYATDKLPGENEDAFEIRKAIYATAEKKARDFYREELGKRKDNVNSLAREAGDGVSDAFKDILEGKAIDPGATGKYLEERGKAAGELGARFKDLTTQANSNVDRLDVDLARSSLQSFFDHMKDVQTDKAKKDRDAAKVILDNIQSLAVNKPKNADAAKKQMEDLKLQLKGFVNDSEHLKKVYRDTEKSPEGVMRNDPPSTTP
jgi:hypothetical protein